MSSHPSASSTTLAIDARSEKSLEQCSCCRATYHHATGSSTTSSHATRPSATENSTATCFSILKHNLMLFHDPRIPFGLYSTLFLQVIRLAQLSIALAACVVYSAPLLSTARDTQHNKRRSTNEVYVVVIASISAVFAAFNLLVPFRRRWWLYLLDALLFVNWLAVFGIFGKLYLSQPAKLRNHSRSTRNMVWLDITSAFLWLVTGAVGIHFCRLAPSHTTSDAEISSCTTQTTQSKASNGSDDDLSAWKSERMLLVALLARLNGIELHDGKQSLHIKWAGSTANLARPAIDKLAAHIPGHWPV